ncbi:hypothetical protein [Roseiflexus sp.]|uniref:hypothetical protein n=1 Tax=Roseiflexus sp. TaxID=2562120 RepID=UPI00258C95D1|nr:hypothetical protein [Roseiflexus sp.]
MTLSPLQIGIILLALATAIIHIVLALPTNLIMFYLNGLGYIGLAAALYLPQLAAYRRTIRWTLIGFTAVTIIGWVVFGERSLIAYMDKLIEVVLIGLLVVEMRRQ